MRVFPAFFALLAITVLPASAQTAAPRGIVPVDDWMLGLKRIEIEVEGVNAWVIFDTGAGVTGIGPDLADRIGCEPYGQLSGFRMTGELLRAPWCGPAAIRTGGVEARDQLMFFDVGSLLPPDWPHVDGIVSLTAFQDGPITLDWPAHRLILESEGSLAERTRDLVGSPLHLQRDIAGFSLSVFIEIEAEHQPLRVLLDSGSAGGNGLAPHSFVELGLVAPPLAREGEAGERASVDLVVAGVPMAGIEVHTEDIIYDGNFGADFLSRNVVTLDFASQQVWVAPR